MSGHLRASELSRQATVPAQGSDGRRAHGSKGLSGAESGARLGAACSPAWTRTPGPGWAPRSPRSRADLECECHGKYRVLGHAIRGQCRCPGGRRLASCTFCPARDRGAEGAQMSGNILPAEQRSDATPCTPGPCGSEAGGCPRPAATPTPPAPRRLPLRVRSCPHRGALKRQVSGPRSSVTSRTDSPSGRGPHVRPPLFCIVLTPPASASCRGLPHTLWVPVAPI